jgi:hypothetical protein
MAQLILKRGSPSRRRADDYDVLENGGVVGRIFFLDARKAAPKCGRAAIAGISSARLTAMRRHARLRWQRSLRAGGRVTRGQRPFPLRRGTNQICCHTLPPNWKQPRRPLSSGASSCQEKPRRLGSARRGPFGGRLRQELNGIGAEHLVALCHAGTQPRVCSATGASRIINFTEVLPFHHISELRRDGSQTEIGGLPNPNWRLWG